VNGHSKTPVAPDDMTGLVWAVVYPRVQKVRHLQQERCGEPLCKTGEVVIDQVTLDVLRDHNRTHQKWRIADLRACKPCVVAAVRRGLAVPPAEPLLPTQQKPTVDPVPVSEWRRVLLREQFGATTPEWTGQRRGPSRELVLGAERPEAVEASHRRRVLLEALDGTAPPEIVAEVGYAQGDLLAELALPGWGAE